MHDRRWRSFDETARFALALSIFVIGSIAIAHFVFRWVGTMGPDSGPRFAMMQSWHERGNPVYLDPAVHGGTAIVTDPLAGYLVETPRGVCTVYPVLFPLLTSAARAILGNVGLVFFPLLGGVLTIFFSYRAAVAWQLRSRVWLVVLLAFASPLLLYSSTFWDHSIHMALIAAATWLTLTAAATNRPRRALVAGVVIGAGLFFHEVFLLFGVCMFAASLSIRRARVLGLAFLAGFAPVVAGWCLSNHAIYGTFRGPHMMGPLDMMHPSKIHGAVDPAGIAERLSVQVAGGTSTTAVVLLVLAAATIAAFALRNLRIAAITMAVTFTVASILLFDARFALGLLPATPWLLLAFARPAPDAASGWRAETRSLLTRASAAFLLAVPIVPLVPGLNWGSRYMLTLLPVLALLALRAVEDMDRRLVAIGAFAFMLGAISVVRGVSAFSWKLGYDRAHVAAIQSTKTELIATDQWWLGPETEWMNLGSRLRLVSLVYGSPQWRPTSPDPFGAPRRAFLDALETERASSFTYLGSDAGFRDLRAAVRSYKPVSVRRTSDLFEVHFVRMDELRAQR